MRFCALNKRIVHAMRFLAATTTRAVSHHTYNTEDPCRHFCRTSRCSHRSAGHYLCLPLVAPPCLAALESFRAEVLRGCRACHHCLRAVLECAHLFGIASSSACDLRISRTWFLKTFQSVSPALFNNTSCFNAISSSGCRTMHMFMLAVRISPKCFSRI